MSDENTNANNNPEEVPSSDTGPKADIHIVPNIDAKEQQPEAPSILTNLEKYNEVYVQRIIYALEAGALTFVIGFVATALVIWLNGSQLGNPENGIDFYREYTEWQFDGPREAVRDAGELLWNATFGLGLTILDVLSNNLTNLVGITRTVSIITVSLFVFVYYRRVLIKRLEVDGADAQLADYQDLCTRKTRYFILQLVFAIATGFGTYILSSVILRLLAFAFPNLALTYFFAAIVIALISAVLTAQAVFWASAIDSREILLLGLVTWIGGLLLSFILIDRYLPVGDEQWWQIAISAAGRYRPASPIFYSAFISAVAALIVVWYDVDSIIQAFIKAIQTKQAELNEAPSIRVKDGTLLLQARDGLFAFFIFLFNILDAILAGLGQVLLLILGKERVNANMFNIVRLLYLFTGLGLLLVGLVPMDAPNGISNGHIAGAIGAAIGIFLLTLIIPKKNYFHAYYRVYSSLYILILVIVGGSFAICNLWSICIGGRINLTGLEFVTLCFVVVWIFSTLDGLVFYTNIKWKSLQAAWAEVKGKQPEPPSPAPAGDAEMPKAG